MVDNKSEISGKKKRSGNRMNKKHQHAGSRGQETRRTLQKKNTQRTGSVLNDFPIPWHDPIPCRARMLFTAEFTTSAGIFFWVAASSADGRQISGGASSGPPNSKIHYHWLPFPLQKNPEQRSKNRALLCRKDFQISISFMGGNEKFCSVPCPFRASQRTSRLVLFLLGPFFTPKRMTRTIFLMRLQSQKRN